MLRIENISKSFDNKTVLNNVALDIEEGAFCSILGPSGCGKTTLLKVIAGLEAQDKGSIFIGGVCCDNIRAQKRGAVIVFQDYGLFPHMTVSQNIEFGLLARKVDRAERASKVLEILDVMQIGDKAGSYPYELSGGQKQRVAIARACVLKPNVLLLDEPFSNLDTRLRDDMREFVSKLQKDLAITTILVTHDKEEAFMLSQKVAIIFDGCVQQYDTPLEIYSRPQTKQVADFIGQANYIAGTAAAGIFHCPLGEFDASGIPDGPAEVMIFYDQFRMNMAGGFPCVVAGKRYKGRTTTYRLITKNEPRIELSVNATDTRFEQEDTVFIEINENSGMVYGL